MHKKLLQTEHPIETLIELPDDFPTDIPTEIPVEIQIELPTEIPVETQIELEFPAGFILVPIELPTFIDMDILKKYVYQDIEANREFFDDTNTTYKISDKKKAEWMLNKSIIGSKWVGS